MIMARPTDRLTAVGTRFHFDAAPVYPVMQHRNR